MSPADQPVEIRLTLTREEAADFLERLADDTELRAEFERDPGRVLRENGIEVSPPEALPERAVAPDPADIRAALADFRAGLEIPYIGRYWPFIPYIGLLGQPPEGWGTEVE